MLPCKEIVRLLNSDEDLSWMRRAELKMHLMMCKHCSRYGAQLQMIKDSFKKLFKKITHVEKAKVIHLENEILKELKKKTGSGGGH